MGKRNLKHFFIDNLLAFVTIFANSQRAFFFSYYRITIRELSSKPFQVHIFVIITISPEVQITDLGKKLNVF